MPTIISDLHLHSRFSRATSKDLTIQNLEKYGRIKGIDLLGTSDFTHPEWIKELKSNLTEDHTGILRTKTGMNFLLQTELSLVYTDAGKGRRVHLLTLAPNFDVVNQITEYLLSKGRIDYDGRPIFKITCPEFTEKMMSISKDIEVIPAHCWTPWFGLLGSKSGFDSVEEAFKDQAKNIHALETGLSSDPAMNWRLSKLDKYALVSFSDSHSFWPWRMGREATMFDIKELTYENIIKSLRTKEGLTGTVEVDPGYGIYHFDGHRNCNISMDPAQSKILNNICPTCHKELTIGVQHRVEDLADRPEGFIPKGAKKFYSLLPLQEIISAVNGSPVASKKTWATYAELQKLGSEFDVLLNTSKEDIAKATDEKLAEYIIKNRNGQIKVIPGYDGIYGYPVLDEKNPPKPKPFKEVDKPTTKKDNKEKQKEFIDNKPKTIKPKAQSSLDKFM